jgi:acetylornithine deacetylase/succinyl-diaminopimelate desuccinylase-like protein
MIACPETHSYSTIQTIFVKYSHCLAKNVTEKGPCRKHPLVTCFTSTYKNFFDVPVTIAGSPAGCDSRTWKKIAGCPTIQYGPGALHQSHAVDEYVEVQDYLDAILLYAGLILSWGNGAPQKP